MYSLKALRALTNKELVKAYESACYAVCHKETVSNCKGLDQIEKVLLERLEGKKC